MSYCKIVLNARITRPPELKESKAGKPFCNVGLAWDTGWGDNKKPCFIDATAFGSRASFIAQFFKQGDGIIIDGTLELNTWEKDGVKKSKHQIIINDATFAEGTKPGDKDSDPSSTKQWSGTEDPSQIPF